MLSRQFRALLRLAGVWSIPWTLIGAGIAVLRWVSGVGTPPTEISLIGWIGMHALGFGAVGLISGINVGLLLARAERGRRVEELSPRRVGLWSVIGGAGPPALFAGLGLVFGAPAAVLVPLIGLGVLSAAISGGVAAAVFGVGRRGALPKEPAGPGRLGP
jgi:hypothetical protein